MFVLRNFQTHAQTHTRTHVENNLLIPSTGSATTVADERNKNTSMEIMITLMVALTSIL